MSNCSPCFGVQNIIFQNIIRMFWFECSFGWKFLFVESYLQDSCWFIIMATIASKRKLNANPIKDKYSALKEVEDGKKVASCCKVRYTKKHFICLAKKWE